jgi:hypothetical protein
MTAVRHAACERPDCGRRPPLLLWCEHLAERYIGVFSLGYGLLCLAAALDLAPACQARLTQVGVETLTGKGLIAANRGKLTFRYSGKQTGTEWQNLIVEFVAGIMNLAGTVLVAIADTDVGAG